MSRSVAAFYDVDGTLVRTNVVHTYAFFARNQPTLTQSVWKTVTTVASIPAFWAADKLTRKGFNHLFYMRYKGESRDRLLMLADDLFDEVIRPSVYAGARDLVRDSKRQGIRQVLVTGALDFTVRPLARYLGVDDVVANVLEFDALGHATGRVRPPIIAGATKAQAIRDYCKRENIDLDASFGYSDSFSDYPMLAVVGRPTAINPDLRLRAIARSYDWPVIELR
jgi:HAD superfamily hydrolase (TIGR01490 family)